MPTKTYAEGCAHVDSTRETGTSVEIRRAVTWFAAVHGHRVLKEIIAVVNADCPQTAETVKALASRMVINPEKAFP